RARRGRGQEVGWDGLEAWTLVRVGEVSQPLEELVIVDALPGVEGIEDEMLAGPGGYAHEEVPRKADAFERHADAAAHFDEHRGQRDRDARPAREHLVQAAVADVVVVVGVAAEAALAEDEARDRERPIDRREPRHEARSDGVRETIELRE